MPNRIYRKFLASAGALITGASLTAPVAAQPHLELGDPGTIAVPGHDPQELAGGKVSFVVDGRHISPMAYVFSKRIAVIFSGEAQPDRACPYIPTGSREPVYHPLQNRVFRVETEATKKEMELVKEKGCLVTDSPPISSIVGPGNINNLDPA